MKIVIVGGGLAGWLSALFFTRKHPNHEYTIIESPNLKPVGVGESTTGLFLKLLFENPINLDFKEFVRETSATPKMAIHFSNWTGIGDEYFSPLDFSPTTHDPMDSVPLISYLKDPTLTSATLNGKLFRENKSPYTKTLQVSDSALHLDSEKTIRYLKKVVLLSSKINLLFANVKKCVRDDDGNITKLITTEKNVSGDLFIDCTGMSRVLRDPEDWISFSGNLPMNAATVFETSHNKNISCVTGAEAASAGWMWKIPTNERYGQGYVHCDSFISEDDTVKEIKSVYPDADIKKKIKFDPGKLNSCVKNNVVSIGLAYHFLEPLQATNIHLTLLQLEWFTVRCMKSTKERTLNEYSINKYNQLVDHTIEGFKHFINAHYSTKRNDTEFWKFNSEGEHLTDFVVDMVGSFKNRGVFTDDFLIPVNGVGSALWTYTLLGSKHISSNECIELLYDLGIYQYALNKFKDVDGVDTSQFVTYNEFRSLIER